MTTLLPARVVELRAQLQDHTILDWIELLALLPDGTGSFSTDELRTHWHCSQPAVSRRLGNLARAGLLSYRAGGGRYRIFRIEHP